MQQQFDLQISCLFVSPGISGCHFGTFSPPCFHRTSTYRVKHIDRHHMRFLEHSCYTSGFRCRRKSFKSSADYKSIYLETNTFLYTTDLEVSWQKQRTFRIIKQRIIVCFCALSKFLPQSEKQRVIFSRVAKQE